MSDVEPGWLPAHSTEGRFPRVREFFRRLLGHEAGQDLVEYGMLAALIAVVAIVAVTFLGTTLANLWGNITTAMSALP